MGLFNKGAEYEDVIYFVDHRDAEKTINKLLDGARRYEWVGRADCCVGADGVSSPASRWPKAP